MPTIKYIEFNGTEHEVDVMSGTTVMQAALDNMIEGIVGECGGSCVCSTCHCMVDPAWTHITGEVNSEENDLLDIVDEREETSRLSCQIKVTDEMDGLVVRLPESQY